MKVLYVEDNPMDAELTRRHLARSAPQITLERVDTLAAARERLLPAGVLSPDLQLPDLLLLDMQLTDGNGMELLSQVRAQALPVAVVMLTGSGDEAAVVAALRGGADDYVVKADETLVHLPARLTEALSRYRAASRRHATPIRVLYAERTDTDVDLLRRYLSRHAPHILLEAVGRASDVLDRLPAAAGETLAGAPELLLLDYQLPGMNALELVKELRQVRGLDLPIIVITGQGDEDRAIQTLKLGATDYLVKQDDLLRHLPVAIESAHFRVQLERERSALADSQARFSQMAEAIDDVFFLADPTAGTMLYVSPAFERLWGVPVARLYRDPLCWLAQVHDDDRARVAQRVNTGVAKRIELEFQITRPDGQWRDVLLRSYPVFDERGQSWRRAGTLQDITRRKQQDARIQHLAYHDALTSLPNRALLMDRLARALSHAQRHGGEVALLFLDLDRFKTINDTLGHLLGDQLLQQVAERLRGALREDDTIARLGGDEFVVVLGDVQDLAQPAHVVDKLMAALALPFAVGAQELYVTGSVGVSLYPRDGTDTDTLLKHADTALYKAKDAGRNAYRFFSPEMDAQAHERLRLENDLRRALERGELVLHYQPQARLADGQVCSVEALVRWNHPRDGLLAPGAFIPLAEETGLILAIGDWVLNEACRQWRRWQDQGLVGLRMAVNLSARQLRRPGLEDTVCQALQTHGLPPGMLELEITESSVMDEPERALALLQRLRALGVLLSIDDFGTGYTNFAYLKQLPLQCLKIDRSFVQGLAEDADDAAIVEAIIAMARTLKLRVLAEGVETAEQHGRLLALGCDDMQGYLMARPMPAEALAAWLVERMVERMANRMAAHRPA